MRRRAKQGSGRGRLAGLAVGVLGVVLVGAQPLAAQEIIVEPATGISVVPGELVEIPILVDMSNAQGLNIASLQFDVKFNEFGSHLQYEGFDQTGLPGGWTGIPNETDVGVGLFRWAGFSPTGTTGSFVAVTLVFRGIAPDGTMTAICTELTAAGSEAGDNLMPFTRDGCGQLCVGVAGWWGDVNDDGQVNIIDAQQIARYSVGLPPPPDPDLIAQFCDVNQDGVCNIIDAQQVARYAIGLPVCPMCIPGQVRPGCDGGPGVPVLLVPEEGAVLDNGCLDHSDLKEWYFDWTDVSGAGEYNLFVKHPTVPNPAIDEYVTPSEYEYVNTGYTTLYQGWTWRVRANVGGQWGDWAPERSFDVEPVDTDCQQTGSLEVTTATTGTDLDPNGYQLSVDGGQPAAIGLNETQTFQDLSAGDHSVLLDDVAANCSVSGDNPRTVNVPASGTGSTTFAVSCGPPPCTTLENGVPVGPLSGAEDSEQCFRFVVPSTNTDPLTIAMSGGTGDADLYVRYGALPDQSTYDCRPFRVGNDEMCQFSDPAAGEWFIMIRGWSAFDGVMLVAALGCPGPLCGTWSGFGSDGQLDLEIMLTPLLEAADGTLSGSGTIGVPGGTPDAFTITAGQRTGTDVFFEMTVPGFTPFNFTGTWDGADVMTGVINESGFVDFPMTFNRTGAPMIVTSSGEGGKQPGVRERVVAGDKPIVERLRQNR